MRFRVIGALFGACAFISSTGFAQVRTEARPDRSPTPPHEPRLARLEALAVVWGRAYLLHPATASERGAADWQRALVAAIPEVERATSPSELAATLNQSLFRRLGDPAAIAWAPSAPPGEPSLAPPEAPQGRMLTGNVGLLTLTDPAAASSTDFAQRLRTALAVLDEAELRVLDLRWSVPRAEGVARGVRWLTLLLDSVRTSGRGLSRERFGWDAGAPSLASWYTQRWRLDPPDEFRPLSHPESTFRGLYRAGALDSLLRPGGRFAIVVNNASIQRCEPLLVALQAQSDVAVIYERTGPLTEDGDTTVVGGVQVRFHLRSLLAADGSHRLQPDQVVDEPLAELALPEAARRAFERKRETRRARFDDRFGAAPAWPRGASPTREERLAGLIAMWVVTRELNPQIGFASIDWARQLPVWMARVEAAEGIGPYYRVLNEILATLRDGHTRAAHPDMGFFGPYGIPAVVMRVEGRPVVVEVAPGAPQTADALRVGDEVLAVDGRPVAEVEAAMRPLISARDPDDFMWGQSMVLRGQQRDSPVTLTVRGARGTRTVTVRRSVVAAESYDTTTVRRLPGRIGYVNLRAIRPEALVDTVTALAQTSVGLVLDLRGYPVLGATEELTARFVDRPVVNRGRAGGIPRLSVDQQRVTRSLVAIPAVHAPSPAPHIDVPTVLLVDGRAGSAAESVALELQAAPNVTVVGARTVGVTGAITTMSLPGGGTLRFTGELMTRPDGSQFFGIGILPAISATPTIRGLRAGRDEVLERGVQALRRQLRVAPRGRRADQ
jgi:C-terminal processing protease CtpA/Prc